MMNRFIFIFAILIGAIMCVWLLNFVEYVKAGNWEAAGWVINSSIFFLLWAAHVVHDQQERANSAIS